MNDELSPTSYAVLGMLTFGASSGYDLLKFVEKSIGHFWSPAKSHVYSELKRLASKGLATEETVEQDSRPHKRVFALTEEGERALKKWLAESEVEPDQVKSLFTLRVFFGHLVPTDVLITQVETVRERAQSALDELIETEKQIKDEPRLFFPYLTLKAGLAHLRAEIDWADDALAALRRQEVKA